MTIVAASWGAEAGFDIHLVAGTSSGPLDGALFVRDDAAPPPGWLPVNPRPADVATIEFVGKFVPTGPQPANKRRRPPVELDTTNGEVRVFAAPLSADRLRNLLVIATIKLRPAAGGAVLEVPTRVHVHLVVRRLWVTPDELTVNRNADGTRFSLLAEFDDGVVGDLSWMPGVTWLLVDPADSAKLDVAANGRLTAKANAGDVEVRASLPASWGGASDTGKVHLKPPRSAEAKLAAGPPRAEVPNVLFLSEGFQATEKVDFEDLVRVLVNDIRTRQSAKPYDVLPINYWMAFLPSRERGMTILQGLRLINQPNRRYDSLPSAVKPQKPVGVAWNLSEAIYEVGLPIPADRGVPWITKLGEWATQFGGHITGARVPEALYREWQQLVDYRLANERDTALGLAAGSRPNATNTHDLRIKQWHPRRATRAHLDLLLDNLKDGGGAPVGATWRGKDRALIYVLCGGAPASGSRTGPPDELIASGLVPRPEIVVLDPIAGTKATNVVPYPLPSTPSLEARTVFVHEVSHAFGLGDEYGGRGDLPIGEAARVMGHGNLQTRSSAVDATNNVRGDRTRWRWARISAAAVLTEKPAPAGARFQILVRKGQAAAFKNNDIVRLRKKGVGQNPTPTDRLKIASITPSLTPTSDRIEVELVPGSSPPIVADYPAGSVLIRPVRAPDPGGGLGPDRPILAPVVEAILIANGRPLNLAAGAACRHGNFNEMQLPVLTAAQVATLLPGRPKWKAWLVGLYDGGMEYDCGVLHPTGACLMRQVTVPNWVAQNAGAAYPLCHVCRYLLVDTIDPSKHGRVDGDYDHQYPQP